MPISFFTTSTAFNPLTVTFPTEVTTLTASGSDYECRDAAGNVIITPTVSLALPRIVPLALGMLALTVRVLDGALGGCTWTRIRPNSLLALALLVASTFLMVVTIGAVTAGSTVMETLPI